MSYEAVVIGAGLAGLCAALRLAEAGCRVVVLARGAGAVQLGGTTIDVLGYAPDRVERPLDALPALAAANPAHPYARLGPERVRSALAWLAGRTDLPPLAGSPERNLLLASPAGAARPTALAPTSLAAGDLARPEPVLLAGLAELRDFYPAYCAANLARAGVPARGVTLPPLLGHADPGTTWVARALDDPATRRRLARHVAREVRPGERVGLPAVLGLEDPEAASDLASLVGAPVFEVATPPPAVPGIRLYRALARALRRAGGRVVIGSDATGVEAARGRVTAVLARTANRSVAYRARAVVLATGGVLAGGIERDPGGALRETVMDLPVVTPPGHGGAGVPAAGAGVAVDGQLRPVGPDGTPLYENVHVAGALLAGAVPWEEKSGNGISVASGYAAAGAIMEAG